MAARNSTGRGRLPTLQSVVSCLVILAVSYHVVRRKVLYGGFTAQQGLYEGGWTTPVLALTVLSALYFITALLVLILELNPAGADKRQRRLKRVLNVQGGLVFSLFIFSPESASVFAALFLPRVRTHYSLNVAIWILAFTIVTFIASIAFYYGDELGPLGITIVAILASGFYVFTLVHSHNAVREKELRQEALALNSELMATRELLAQTSRQTERLRIARNIHDLLGHQLTGLILNLEVASHISEGKAQDKVKQSLSLAKSLLGDLRDAVSDLRESASLDFNQALKEITGNISEVEVNLSIEEGLVVGNAETAETLIRCIQESLTNIRRHANATRCFISLYRRDGEVVLQVNDNGSVESDISPGNGLNGMMERIDALSGKLRWGKKRGSFFLEAIIPLRAI
jgi:two-component system sensor histidine kinase DesK